MCGIAGQVRADGAPVEPELLERMCAAIEHRGPDSRGTHRSDGAGLGIQRLRVIDVETGDQPIENEDGSVVVVLNGEIYNFRELRRELERKGHRFATDADTEAIVHLYEEEGPECVRRLHGMFAFALWDRRHRRLLIARDRAGKKPLYWHERGGTLTFASELGALLQEPRVPREPDPVALDRYLAYGYVPAPLSAFRDVRKLPPASLLVFEHGRARVERYWRLDYSAKLDVRSLEEAGELVRDALRQAVRKRLVSDVPLGAFLSGGIDSSAVVAAMAEQSPEPVRTFSIGFENDRFDELPHARRVAEQFGTEHREFTVRADGVELLPKLVRHYGEPFADSSAIPSFYLAELTRRHVTVALNGDGGDECFAGYMRYAGNALGARLERLPLGLRRALAAAGGRLPEGRALDGPVARARRLARALPLDGPARYARTVSLLDAEARGGLYTDEFAAALAGQPAEGLIESAWSAASGEHVLDVMLEVDVETYLPGDLLAKIDIATMAHGLEARSPFLDHELMQLAASLPPSLKLHGTEKKLSLRAALRGWVPDAILDRPKQGFQVPLPEWLRGDLRPLARELLLGESARARGMFREEGLEALLGRHGAGRTDESQRIWALMMLELWQREFVDAAPTASRLALEAA